MDEEHTQNTEPTKDLPMDGGGDINELSLAYESKQEKEKRPEIGELFDKIKKCWEKQDRVACVDILQKLSQSEVEEIFQRIVDGGFFDLASDEQIQWVRFIPASKMANIFLDNKEGASFFINDCLYWKFKGKLNSEATLKLIDFLGEERTLDATVFNVIEPFSDEIVIRLLDKLGNEHPLKIFQNAGKMGDAVAQKLVEMGNFWLILEYDRYFANIDFRKYTLMAMENPDFASFDTFQHPKFNDDDLKVFLHRALELKNDKMVKVIIESFRNLYLLDNDSIKKILDKVSSGGTILSLVKAYDGPLLNASILDRVRPEYWYNIIDKIDLGCSKELADKILNSAIHQVELQDLLDRILHNFNSTLQKYFFVAFLGREDWQLIAHFWDVFKDMGMSDDDLLEKMMLRLEKHLNSNLNFVFDKLRHVSEKWTKAVWRYQPGIVCNNLEKFSGAGDLNKDERMSVIASRNFKYSLDCPLSEELLRQIGKRELPDAELRKGFENSKAAEMYVETWRFRGYLNILKIAKELNWEESFEGLLPREKAEDLLDKMLEEENWQMARELADCIDFLGYDIIAPKQRQAIMKHTVSADRETKKRPAYKEIHLSQEFYLFYNNMSILGELKGLESGMSRGFSPDDLMNLLAVQKKLESEKNLVRQEQELGFSDKVAVSDMEKSIEREIDKIFEWMRQYLIKALQSELRNQGCNTQNNVLMVPPGGVAIECDKSEEELRRYSNVAGYAFSTLEWNNLYGGKAWAEIAELVGEMWAENIDFSDKIILIDRAIDLEHNSGMVFDKDARIKFDKKREKRILNKKRYATNSTEMFEQLSEEIHDGELKRKISARIDLLNKIKKRTTSAKGSD